MWHDFFSFCESCIRFAKHLCSTCEASWLSFCSYCLVHCLSYEHIIVQPANASRRCRTFGLVEPVIRYDPLSYQPVVGWATLSLFRCLVRFTRSAWKTMVTPWLSACFV